jgi:hypothetical protein
MPIPTDRGYVWVTPEDGDTQNVQIATTIEGGRPAGVFAEYVGQTSVVVDPGVTLTAADGARHSDEVVQVFSDENGAVHVAPITTI